MRQVSDEELTRSMAQLSAGLRKSVPAGDQWQVSIEDLGNLLGGSAHEGESSQMVAVNFTRPVDGRKYHYREYISPIMLVSDQLGAEWVGQYMGQKWIGKVAEAIAEDSR